MSGDESVGRFEFETYKTLATELRGADRAEIARVAREVEQVERNGSEAVETLRKDVDIRFNASAAQREEDRAGAEHKKELSWQMKLAVAGLLVAMAGLYVQALSGHH